MVPPATLVTSESAPPQLLKLWKFAFMRSVPALFSFDASPRHGSPSFQAVLPLRVSVLPPRSWTDPLIASDPVLASVDVVAPVSEPLVHVQFPVTVNGPAMSPPCTST